MSQFADVDPRDLHLPPSRAGGADPVKLHRQIAQYGDSLAGMPAITTYRGRDGGLIIFDGVTRATRAAKLRPGIPVRIENLGDLPADCSRLSKVGERLP